MRIEENIELLDHYNTGGLSDGIHSHSVGAVSYDALIAAVASAGFTIARHNSEITVVRPEQEKEFHVPLELVSLEATRDFVNVKGYALRTGQGEQPTLEIVIENHHTSHENHHGIIGGGSSGTTGIVGKITYETDAREKNAAQKVAAVRESIEQIYFKKKLQAFK